MCKRLQAREPSVLPLCSTLPSPSSCSEGDRSVVNSVYLFFFKKKRQNWLIRQNHLAAASTIWGKCASNNDAASKDSLAACAASDSSSSCTAVISTRLHVLQHRVEQTQTDSEQRRKTDPEPSAFNPNLLGKCFINSQRLGSPIDTFPQDLPVEFHNGTVKYETFFFSNYCQHLVKCWQSNLLKPDVFPLLTECVTESVPEGNICQRSWRFSRINVIRNPQRQEILWQHQKEFADTWITLLSFPQ